MFVRVTTTDVLVLAFCRHKVESPAMYDDGMLHKTWLRCILHVDELYGTSNSNAFTFHTVKENVIRALRLAVRSTGYADLTRYNIRKQMHECKTKQVCS